MPFLYFSIVWCVLILGIIMLVRKIHYHMKEQGHEVAFPFAPSELFRFISICSRTQKETNDTKLKTLLISLNVCYAIGLVFFLFQVFST